MLVRRNIEEPQERTFYLAFAPAWSTLDRLARTAGKRWKIEETFEQAKGEAGLDEHEVRKWDCWYRHATLSLLAHAYLCVVRSMAEKEWEAGKKGIENRSSAPNRSRRGCRRSGA
jgi:SRSO17 transposase